MISIGVAWGLFMLAWNLRDLSEDHSVIFIGIAFLFTGAIDLLHTLAYKGMNVLPGSDANLATQFWIAGRYLQSTSLLVMPFVLNRRISFGPVIALFSCVTVLLLLAIAFWHVFPVCFVEGAGLTPFKVISEYVVSFILALSAVFFFRRRSSFDPEVLRLVMFSLGLLILSELAFTFYIEVYDLSNASAHLIRIISYFLLYKAIIQTGMKKPFNLLFRNLKQSELELIKINDRLQQELGSKDKAEISLKIAVEELERSNKELEQFAYIASHDLQEPVRMVSNYTQLLERRYKDKLDSKALEYIEFAVDGARRMHMLITGLLEYSRITTNARQYSPVDCNKVMEYVLKNLEISIRESGARIYSEVLPVVMADEVQLIQLFQNLISNAIKFRRGAEMPEIHVSAAQENGKWIFSVKDNGIGIDPQYGERIFQIFQRLHLRDEYTGTGIGLAVCKRIVERHGGKIWIESELNNGATFYFTFSNN
ncbi:MAG: GHKL domain-containing protein [Ignavibacteria bacterium]|jgi:signal transduction histidine kinase|nr:GHKL domain-containing protein [Ignavibacteria bacterium]MCU7504548.1 GHKL domain-containing protein [Ignavibacteria bacterium]MCU7516614.1 GHKL domain-containing protein [Ignavibacteria bacterium]